MSIPFRLVGDVVEGTTWVQTVEGFRFPTELAASTQGKNFRYAPLPCSTRGKLSAQHRLGHDFTTIWSREAEAGRPLLKVRVTDGVGDVEPLHMEEYRTEREKAGDSYEEADLSDEEEIVEYES